MALNNLGNADREMHRFQEAIGCYEQAIAIMRETGDRHVEGMVLGNLGTAYLQMGQPAKATACWREAAAAMRNAGDHQEARLLEQLAAKTQSRRRWWALRRRLPS